MCTHKGCCTKYILQDTVISIFFSTRFYNSKILYGRVLSAAFYFSETEVMFGMRERLEEHFSNTIFEPQLKIDVSQKILSESKEITFMRQILYVRCFHRGYDSYNKTSRSVIHPKFAQIKQLPNGFVNYYFDFVLMFLKFRAKVFYFQQLCNAFQNEKKLRFYF